MSTSQTPEPKKRERQPAKPWKRAFFRFDHESASSKNEEEFIEEGLEKIYAHAEDLKELQKESRWWWVKWFTGGSIALALLAMVAWWGFTVLQPNNTVKLEALEVTIEGPKEVRIGEESTYAIHWKNNSMQPIQDARLRIGIPPVLQVTYLNPWPIDSESMTWKLGLLGPGTKGVVTFKALPFGEVGSRTAIQAVMTAPQQGALAVKDALTTESILMKDSVIRGRWNIPARVIAGEQVAIEYEAYLDTKEGLKEVVMSIEVPDGFSLASTTASSTKSTVKQIKVFGGESTTTLRAVGAFSTTGLGDQRFTAKLQQRHDEKDFTLAISSTTVPVLASDLSLQLVVNGSTSAKSIQPGDSVRTTLAYANTSPDTLHDVTLTLVFESQKNTLSSTGTSLLNWSALEDSVKGVTSTKTRLQTITYTKKQIPALEVLKSGDKGTLDITLPTVMPPSSTQQAVIVVSAHGTVGRIGETTLKRSVQTQQIPLTYRSDVVFASEIRYFTEEGAPIGSGPLPPVVGKATRYRVYWAIDKHLHELSDLTVTTTLPQNVKLLDTKEVSAGELVFEPNGRVLRWTLNAMPQNVNAVMAWFDIELVPTASDVGRFATLLQPQRFSALNKTISEPIEQKIAAQTTDLESDEQANGKGVVKK